MLGLVNRLFLICLLLLCGQTLKQIEVLFEGGHVKPLCPLPKPTESYSYCLTIYAASTIAAKERDHSRDFLRLKHSVLGVNGRALAPHFLDTNVAPFGF